MTTSKKIELIKQLDLPTNILCGNRLHKLRIYKGLAMDELGIRAIDDNGSIISRQTINDYEKGKSGMKIDKLDRLCKVLGITLYEFFKEL